jgi:hypothetical protein
MIDLTGQKFERLTVILRKDIANDGHILWLCKCKCGKEIIISSHSLKSGNTKSCGCLQKELLIKRLTKHGHLKNRKTSKTYNIWRDMIQRCTNSNYKEYKYYGGRGLTVCERWRGENGFINFLEDMGEPPGPEYQIDRINNNLGYYKENCRWTTAKQNSRNKRNNRFITLNDKTKCIAEWAEELIIYYRTILSRLRYGWSIEKALTTPVEKKNE